MTKYLQNNKPNCFSQWFITLCSESFFHGCNQSTLICFKTCWWLNKLKKSK